MEAPRVTIWNEYRHEREEERYRAVYPDGIHGTLAAAFLAAHQQSAIKMSHVKIAVQRELLKSGRLADM